MNLSADEAVDALRAAGEPTRLRILALLAVEELSVMELGRILDQSQPRVSRHLKLMSEAGLIERRHGDIFATRRPSETADLVVVHQVLHYLSDPASAVTEAARLVAPGGRLLIVDFAPHALEFLRSEHQHRRLGFSDEEIGRWLEGGGLKAVAPIALKPEREGRTVKIWTGQRAPLGAANRVRSVA